MPRVNGRLVLLAVALVGLLISIGCLTFPGDLPAPISVGDRLLAEYVVNGVHHPTALAFAADGRVFYTEKNTGRVRVIVDGRLAAGPFTTVPVNYAGKRGLLGIALHPEFATNHRVYVFYTRSDTGTATNDPQAVIDNRVVYFTASGNVASGGEMFVASLPATSGTNRVGGRIVFTGDSKLLVAIGDLTAAASAQSETVLVGKVLRYNDDGSIPDNNPTAGSPVYARGLRCPRGLCLDPTDGALFVIDHHDNGRDEVNRVLAGMDYGWPNVVGRADTATEQEYAASHPDYVDPLIDTGPINGGLVGGSFNPSSRYGPTTLLHYFYGRSGTRNVISAELTTDRSALAQDVRQFAGVFPGTITDVVFTPAGTLYIACENAIFRLRPYP